MAHFIYNAYGGDGSTTTLSRFLLMIIRPSSEFGSTWHLAHGSVAYWLHPQGRTSGKTP